MSDLEDKKPRGRRHRRHRRVGLRHRRVGLWMLSSFLTLTILTGLLLISLRGVEIKAPDWVRDKVTERINRDSETFNIGIGNVAVVVKDDWLPQFLLRNVVLSDKLGRPIVKLNDVQVAVALNPLLQGQVQPSSILLTGVGVILRRSAKGRVNLAFEDAQSAGGEAANFAALIHEVDQFLLRPQFADLNQVNIENLTLRYEDLRTKRAWTVDGGQLGMTRTGDVLQLRGNFFLLGARDYATSLEMNYTGKIGSSAAEMGISFEDMPAEDIAGQSPALAWLEALDAPISGALRASVDEDGALGPLNATLQIGEGVLQPTEATKPIPFTAVRSYFSYDPNTQRMRLDELSIDSKWGSARAEGQAFLLGIENGLPQELLGQIRVTNIKANPMGLYPQPIEIDAANMDIRLQFDPFVVSLGEMSFADHDSRLVLSGEVAAKPEGWDLTLSGLMDKLAGKRLMELWPVGVSENTRDWIEKNVYEAGLSNIQIAIRSLPKHRPNIFIGFDFNELKTRFIKGVPPIETAAGHATLNENRFVVTAESGYITAVQGGRIDISGTSFIVPDVRIKRSPARALMTVSGTITAALSLLDEEPFRFMQKADMPVTLADGHVAATGQLDFLLGKNLKTKDVAFNVTGILSDVRSKIIVPGRVLVASELSVTANNNKLRIGGEGRIGMVPFGGAWQTDLRPDSGDASQLKGWIELSERFTDEFGIGLPPDSISGTGRGDITVEIAKGKPGKFHLTSDLAGIGLGLRQLSWSSSEKSVGTLNVSGALGEPPVIDSLLLEASGLRVKGSVRLKADGTLDRASFTEVKIGTWLDAPVDLIGRGLSVPPAIRVTGGRIDLRQTSLGGDDSGGKKNGGPVSLALDLLQVSDGIALTSFKAELDMSGGVEGNFTGRVNGGTVVTGRVVPKGGRSAFRILSDDAGGVMSSAGLLKQARDGKMVLILNPAPEIGSYKGRLGIDNFRVKDAPAMAALLNAISVIGILQQLESDGLHFSRLDAKFVLQPDRVTLLSGSAVGASLGISMDGYYFMESGRMDMQGVFSPLYLVNAIGGIFTRRGEGLIGFNYKLKGLASAPKVTVNPLSILTPGMFREMFRKKPPKVTYNTGNTGPTGGGDDPVDLQPEPEKPDESPRNSSSGRP